MYHTQPTSAPSNFQLIFDNALKAYKKRTKNDLLTHQLADRLKACNSASSIRTVLQELVQEFNESQHNDSKWLDPIVNVLLAFSETLGEGVGLVCFRIRTCPRSTLSFIRQVFSPAKVIFIGFGVLLSVRTLLDTFVRFIVIRAILRQLRMFARIKTLSLRCSSA
jgi:hypothetical protein